MIRMRELASGALRQAYRTALRLQLLAQLDVGLLNTYQPNPFTGRSPGDRGDPRRCRERFEAISAALPADDRLTTLDVGCSLGYFTFRMAERGGFCIGIDYERHPIMAARSLVALHEVDNVAFSRMTVDVESARALPQVDTVICLSVFHHWARKLGESHACEIMSALAGRAQRFLVFDTGQPDEKGTSWADDLRFMSPDPDTWIRELLDGFGFPAVRVVGTFPTTVSPTPRALYVAARDADALAAERAPARP